MGRYGWKILIIILASTLMSKGSTTEFVHCFRQMRYVMGTLCEIRVYDRDKTKAELAINHAFEEMQRVDRLLSNYDASTELSQMNAQAARTPFVVSTELYNFLQECARFHHVTEGAFDPTVGPLVRAWGYFSGRPHVPSQNEIKSTLSRIGFDKVRFDFKEHSVYFPVTGMEIDPGGIGKGYAVDRAAGILREHGVTSALINSGSSTFLALGYPPGQESWWVGIKDNSNFDSAVAFVPLKDNSLSTSGNSERFTQSGRRRFGHIFDPRTGKPVEGVSQVSVIAPTAIESDALTKAAFILPREQSFRIFQNLEGVHALRIEHNPRTVCVTPWSKNVFRRVHRGPLDCEMTEMGSGSF